MKVLVTGATGLLGSHVVRELVKRNYKVRVLVRPESNLSALEKLPVELLKGYLTNEKDVVTAVEGCAYVIHSAALAVHKPTRLEAFRQVNIDSTRYVTNAGKKTGIKRMVYVSTANCFLSENDEIQGDEESNFPVWMRKSGYAYSKYLAQQQVLKEVVKGELDAVVVNPTFIVGKDYKPEGGKIFSFILNRRIAFHPMGGKNFIDAEAAAVGVVNAMEKGRRGECYILAGENLSYKAFFKFVKSQTGQRTILVPMPCMLLKLAGRIGDVCEKVFNHPVPLTYVNARMLCLKNYYTPLKAIRELNLPLMPAKQSIITALKWFDPNKNRIRLQKRNYNTEPINEAHRI